jgi:hypothetical protein
MPFINELIPEADKARIDWSKFKAWSFSKPLHPWKWTIDRERDIFFVELEGQGPDSERPETYAMSWHSHVIRVEAEVSGSGGEKFWAHIEWNILKIEIPEEIQLARNEILLDLEHAIDAHGRLFDRSHIQSVRINFSAGVRS